MEKDPWMGHKLSYRILGALALLFALGGCSSDNPEDPRGNQGDYHFSFKVDEEPISYPYTPGDHINLTGILDHDPNSGLYVANIAGIKDNREPVQTSRLILFIGDTKEIGPGDPYSNFPDGEAVDAIFHMGYYDAQGNIFIASINTIAPPLYDLATVTFTEITQDQISGTFSGTLKWYEPSGGTLVLADTVEITEGSFTVPRH